METKEIHWEGESRWDKLLEYLPVLIFESNLENEILYTSKNVYELLGYRPEEMLGKDAVAFFHPDDRKRLLKNVRRKLKDNGINNSKYRIRKKNGRYITVAFRSVPVFENGIPTGLMGIGIDVTLTEKLEKKLADSEMRYRSLFTHAPLGIYRTTPDGKIVVANDALIKMMGYGSLKELKKINLEKGTHQTGFVRSLFKEKLEKEGKVSGFETQWTRKDGTRIWVRENAILIKNKKGQPVFYDGVVEDISFRKKAESLLLRQQALLNISQQMAAMGSWEEDLADGTVLWSDQEYDIFELPQGTPVDEKLFFNYVHPDDRPLLRKRMELLSCKASKIELEYRLVVNGKIKWIRSVMDARCNEKGEALLLYGMDMDITPQKEQQIRLEKERQLLKKTQELGRIGSWELDVKTKTVQASDVVIDLYGLPPKASYTLSDFTRRIHPDDLKDRGMAKGNWRVLKEGSYHSTYRLLVNGKVIWVNAAGEVIFDEQGKASTVLAAVQDITWQKEKETRLKHLEQEKQAIIQAIPDMIFLFNRQGVYLDFIPGIDIRPLIPPEKFLGKNILEVLPPGIATKHLKTLQKAFDTGNVQVSEYVLKDTDGHPKFFEARFSPVNRERAVVIVRDVTRREKALASLRVSNENLLLYLRALEESPASVVITDAEGNIAYVNKKFTQNTGFSPEEVLGKNARILKSGHESPAFYHRLWDTIRSGKTWKGEYVNRKKGGKTFWEAATINPIFNTKGEITHFVQVSEDITERKKAEASIKQLAAIVASSDAIIIGKTLDGIITSWNKGAEKVYGYKAREVIGLPINIIVPGELKNELVSFSRRIKAGQKVDKFETRRIRKDGTLVEVSLSLSGIKDENGELTGISVVGFDITREKQLERELIAEKEIAEKATRTKSLFLANMSHEIRTPLNAIIGFSEILSKRLKDPILKEYVESMHRSGEALLNLINDLLDLSKAEAGKMAFYNQSIDVRYLVHDIESIFRLKAQQKQLEFRVKVAEDVPHNLFLDEMKIRQILLNLTSNAIKFTKKGSVEITIKSNHLDASHADLVIEVRDTGTGIPKTSHKKIFQLFEQQDAAISKHYGGTGLGLAIIQQIVSQMQGRIDVVSEVGKGSLFRVVLPGISLSEKPPAEKTAVIPEDIHFKPADILVVDDTLNNRIVMKAVLEDYPFNILEAANGKEALDILKENKVDLIFMDIRMPVMDGLQATEIIRSHTEWSHIPIVALTASATEFEENKFTRKGFDNYLRKPATLSEILSVLMQYLKYEATTKEKKIPFTVSKGMLEHYVEIEKVMLSEILPLREQLLGIRPREEVKKLALLLIDLGERYEAEELVRYGEKLLVANKNFLLEKEKQLIDGLPDFTGQLKKYYHEYQRRKEHEDPYR